MSLQCWKVRDRSQGISLIELLIAMALGLLVTSVVIAVFVSSSRTFRDVQKSGELIENGRYAISLLADDIRHTGYYGQLCNFDSTKTDDCYAPTFTGTLDPCANITSANFRNALAYPVQLFPSSSLATQPTVPSCLASGEVKAGSDILVVRRVDTNSVAVGANTILNGKYLQANSLEAELQTGNGNALGGGKKADGTNATILNRDGTAAPIRQLKVQIYYLSPCSQTTCGSGSDQLPTLKRMELVSDGVWNTVPLVSGIEYFKVDLGVDSSPSTINTSTKYIGDGAADGPFVRTITGPATWNDVVSLQVSLLSRTLDTVAGYSDSNSTYNLGVAGNLTGSGNYKRHVFTTEIRLNNVSGRRERLAGE